MKPPFSYYGGKQNMLRHILPLIPEHTLYNEPFCGGAALFWQKEPSAVEVLNDTNKELVNFYETVQREFPALEMEIRISLHSRTLHKDASVIYNSPHLFTRIQRAWAIWVLANQSFSSMLDGSWGYDKKKNTTSKKITNKREAFTEEFAIRLQNVQLECTDAIRIIRSRDTPETFHYIDPPYFNSDCGHYDGYTIEDFEMLLKQLEKLEGKFILSSYPSDLLNVFKTRNKWVQKTFEKSVSVNKGMGGKKKTEVITANFVI
ncbi:MAG: DNA adenine methylase [Flavobacteriales bacterium]|nr:DNA adenine methylase [Flavobacteriales bacterium]